MEFIDKIIDKYGYNTAVVANHSALVTREVSQKKINGKYGLVVHNIPQASYDAILAGSISSPLEITSFGSEMDAIFHIASLIEGPSEAFTGITTMQLSRTMTLTQPTDLAEITPGILDAQLCVACNAMAEKLENYNNNENNLLFLANLLKSYPFSKHNPSDYLLLRQVRCSLPESLIIVKFRSVFHVLNGEISYHNTMSVSASFSSEAEAVNHALAKAHGFRILSTSIIQKHAPTVCLTSRHHLYTGELDVKDILSTQEASIKKEAKRWTAQANAHKEKTK